MSEAASPSTPPVVPPPANTQESPALVWFVNFLIRWRFPLFVGATLLTLLAAIPASQLQFDQSIESLFSEENQRLRDYVRSKGLFGGDEFVIVAYRDPNLFDSDGTLSDPATARMRQLAEELAAIPGVQAGSVQSLSKSLGILKLPLLKNLQPQVEELMRGMLLGDDRQTTAVILRLVDQGKLSPAKPVAPTQPADPDAETKGEGADAPPRDATGKLVTRAKTIALIKAVAAKQPTDTYVVGEPVHVHEMFYYVEVDGAVLGYASSALLMLVILVLFRSIRWVILPLLLVHVTLIWTKGLLVLAQMQLSMVSSMLTSLVTIIGVATVVHVAVQFRSARKSMDRKAALRTTLMALTVPIVWTCLTTAAGFGAQITSAIHPVRSFGVMTAVATMLVLAAGATLLPFTLLMGGMPLDPKSGPARRRLKGSLGLITDAVERYPGTLSLVCAALLIFTLAGFTRLRIETDFSKNFRETSPLVQSLNFVEQNLGGSGTWEVSFHAPEQLDKEFLEEVRAFAAELRAMRVEGKPALTKVIALTDGLDIMPGLGFTQQQVLSSKLRLLRTFQSDFTSSLYNSEKRRMRIMLRAREQQPAEVKLADIRQVEEAARKRFPASGEDAASASGLFVLLAYLTTSLLDDQWVSFAAAGGGIFLMMSFAFRSVWIGLISLVPNLLPIVIVIGTMGWIGLPVNIATAMIASVSMGLTVDSSIHYLAGWERARRQGMDFFAALRETNQEVGSALVYANLALVVGFMVLTLSQFVPLVYFGILVSVAMLGGLVGNLVVLPLLMRAIRSAIDR